MYNDWFEYGYAVWLGLGRLPEDQAPASRNLLFGGSCWSGRLHGKYINEQHGANDECFDFDTAKQKCEEATDCHGIATQSNICSGKYRVTHGSTATLVAFPNWASFNLWAYTLDRSCLSPSAGDYIHMSHHFARILHHSNSHARCCMTL